MINCLLIYLDGCSWSSCGSVQGTTKSSPAIVIIFTSLCYVFEREMSFSLAVRRPIVKISLCFKEFLCLKFHFVQSQRLALFYLFIFPRNCYYYYFFWWRSYSSGKGINDRRKWSVFLFFFWLFTIYSEISKMIVLGIFLINN